MGVVDYTGPTGRAGRRQRQDTSEVANQKASRRSTGREYGVLLLSGGKLVAIARSPSAEKPTDRTGWRSLHFNPNEEVNHEIREIHERNQGISSI